MGEQHTKLMDSFVESSNQCGLHCSVPINAEQLVMGWRTLNSLEACDKAQDTERRLIEILSHIGSTAREIIFQVDDYTPLEVCQITSQVFFVIAECMEQARERLKVNEEVVQGHADSMRLRSASVLGIGERASARLTVLEELVH